MIKNLKSIFRASMLALAGTAMLWSCNSEADNLGSQFFEGATGTETGYPVIAYNVDNHQKIQSDMVHLTYAMLGAFKEPQMGSQKAAYVTQVRLSSYAPDFGTNAVVDSVVLVMKPLYASDSATTTTLDKYNYPVGNIESKKVVNTYPVTKYGRKGSVTVNVREVNDFLGAATDTIYSNRTVATGAILGSKVFNGTVNSVKITKNADNTDLLVRDASLRIPLDAAFFQSKILAKAGATELSDASNFVRYFRGLQISVAENDGFMAKFRPNEMQLVMYYKRDVTTNGTTTPTQTTYSFDLGGSNVHFSQISFDTDNAGVQTAGYNSATGDKRLYAQGMGGPGIGIRIPTETINKIKQLYKTQGIGILTAKIRLYTDASVWTNNFEKPASFTVGQKGLNTFLSDVTALAGNAVYSMVKAYDLAKNPAYYDITITQTFKDIIEKEAENKDIILNVGTYEVNANTGAVMSQSYNTRAYTPNRVVLVGTDASNANQASLNIIYTKK